MTPQEMALANHHLAMAGADLTRLPGNSRMLGLGVVGRLAARHELEVALGDAPLGGTVARVSLPPALLAPPKVEEEPEATQPTDEAAMLSQAASVFARPGLPKLGAAAAAPSAPLASAALAPAVAAPAIPVPGAPTPATTPPATPVDATPNGVSVIPLQPRSPGRTDTAPTGGSGQESLRPGAEGLRQSGQSFDESASEQVAGRENAYNPSTDGASSITVGTHTDTRGALPARRPAESSAGVTAAAQKNSGPDDGPAPSGTASKAPETVGGLRRRIRGENLPDTGQPEPKEPTTPRDAAGVRAALSSFKAGRDLANRDT